MLVSNYNDNFQTKHSKLNDVDSFKAQEEEIKALKVRLEESSFDRYKLVLGQVAYDIDRAIVCYVRVGLSYVLDGLTIMSFQSKSQEVSDLDDLECDDSSRMINEDF